MTIIVSHNIQGGNSSVSRSNWSIYLEILGFKEPEKREVNPCSWVENQQRTSIHVVDSTWPEFTLVGDIVVEN